jgi:hypothetical protein
LSGARALAALAVAVALGGCGSAAKPAEQLNLPSRASDLPAPRSSHVFVMVMENRSFNEVIGRAEAPVINALANRGALATQSHAVIHESLPNYLALTGGSTFGVKQNCDACHFQATSIADQLEVAGLTWKAYVEGLPGECYTGGDRGGYAKRHNPFIYYDRIARDPRRCALIQPLRNLAADLKAGTLPTFAWISPNLCNDGHSCPLSDVDSFLGRLLPFIERALGPHGYLVLTWDEGAETDTSSCCGNSDGGHIATIVDGPDVRPGFRLNTPVDQYSLLRTIEDSLGLPPLRRAGAPAVQTLAPVFSGQPRIR